MSETVIADSTRVRRFTLSDRLEHLVQMVSFVVLAITGLVQKWPKNGLSEGVIDLLGGIESVRIIHRVFATILMVAVVYHFGAAGYRRVVLRQRRTMIPRKGDGRAIVQSIQHAIGRRDAPPEQGRFAWQEKVEYWSLVWGNVIMIVTGFLLWNPIATTQVLPGEFIPAAKSAHGNEAFLAVLAIVVWHTYHVHVKHWNTSIWTGYMSREEMAAYHPLELADIESGDVPRPLEGEERRRATTRFFSVYGGVAAILLVGIYFFVTFENTAIETIEPIEDVTVFAPVETTTTTAGPTTTTGPATTEPPTTTVAAADLSWDTFAGSFASSCGGCHGDSGGMAGVSLTSYAGVSAVITPGDPEGSTLVALMEAGGHPGALDAEVLAALREWIAAGAPETADATPSPTTLATTTTITTTTAAAGELSWATFAGSFASSCGGCHGDSGGMAGVSLTSYAGVSAVITPGDPEGSTLVALMEAGGHPGALDAEVLAALREWIAAGAPES